MYGQLFDMLVLSLPNKQIKCTATPRYIWLHVSAVKRPSSGQQGTVLLRYIPTNTSDLYDT